MARKSNTDRSQNFVDRLRVTWDSESDPEMYTPMSAGAEELPEYSEMFPIVRQFRQTNMNSPRRKGRDDSQRGKDQK